MKEMIIDQYTLFVVSDRKYENKRKNLVPLEGQGKHIIHDNNDERLG